MYSKETIEKYNRLMTDAINNILVKTSDLDALTTSISAGNRKIGRVLNVSTAPIKDCGNCAHCMHYCYDIKAVVFHTNSVLPARAKNHILANENRTKFFADIENRIARRRTNKFFRWHVAGDIIDADYFENMIAIARRHTDFTFWTYTKRFDIANEWIRNNGDIPANMHIMFSVWDGMPTPNPYNMPVFACRLKDGNKDITDAEFSRMYKCPGNCDVCKAAGRGCVVGESAYADEH